VAITRWDPFGEMMSLRDAMDRLFAESVIRPSALTGDQAPLALDVCEEGDDYVIEAALPGVNPDAVNVSVIGNRVQISGEYEAPPEGRQHLVRERRYGRFERTITLPMDVDADKAKATYEHGLLRLTVPKAESARPRRIAIASGPEQRRDLPPAVETRV